MIEVKNITHIYSPGTPYAATAIENISLEIADGSYTAIAGHTGSGKSTLIEHFNGLLQPTTGEVLIDGQDINAKGDAAKIARQKVGLVFQYPEHQLFDETVAADVAFGPKCRNLSESEINIRVKTALEFVGLDYNIYKDKSPFDLSGGQKRRAAIAGIIALNPKYLVLDEPTAGLDPQGRADLLEKIAEIHKKRRLTVVLVTHDMDAIASYADRVVVLNAGHIVLDAPPSEAFLDSATIEAAGLKLPQLHALLNTVENAGLKLPPRPKKNKLDINDAVKMIAAAVK